MAPTLPFSQAERAALSPRPRLSPIACASGMPPSARTFAGRRPSAFRALEQLWLIAA